MDVGFHSRRAILAQRARAELAKRGVTPSGHRLWTASEEEIVRKLYPDYAELQRRLPHRTYYSLRYRVRVLGLAKPRRRLSAREVSTIRRMYRSADRAAILAALPGLTWDQVKCCARQIKVRRNKLPYVPTGYRALDLLRKKARSLDINMPDLDEIAGTKRFFQKGNWYGPNSVARACLKGARALGGDLSVEWSGIGDGEG